ncbi:MULTISPECIES: hypothetical protein [Vibrio]|uniref:Uncharacterized protein n=3 Tax=Vibrio TaxID=662 RepID=A0A2N7NMK9_9VIBR|nr:MULTISPECIES: hypothetical protein [Vibrio]EAQ55418.1 hypothetical protein MED222_08358 [Vibrio sp. MED222]PMP17219.1 hypothetical protein BCS92_05860 [Vibrio tasmaniensis]TKG33624.1 hypothetical protein FC057_10870 [Vibrio tasmaniensis]TKG39777.1 hypothetical protein FC061_24735 [Vibrio tasmaniensis]TKG39843.1 hypothetical protein FC060_24120 [Vibrio tasmaniensis]
MQQGYMSESSWDELTFDERSSLQLMREKYKNSDHHLKLIDQSYEAMGKIFRSRINSEVIKYKRYEGDLDGVYLIINKAIHDFFGSSHFPATKHKSKEIHDFHQKQRQKASKLSDEAFCSLERTINWLSNTTTTKQDELDMSVANEKLIELKKLISSHLERVDLHDRSPSKAESFVLGTCNNLIWFANIKATRTIDSSGGKTPFLRFLEVFFPFEAEPILSSLYEKQKRLPIEKRIGGTFIPVRRG